MRERMSFPFFYVPFLLTRRKEKKTRRVID